MLARNWRFDLNKQFTVVESAHSKSSRTELWERFVQPGCDRLEFREGEQNHRNSQRGRFQVLIGDVGCFLTRSRLSAIRFRTSVSLTCLKSRYHSPTARNTRGVARQTRSSVSLRSR